MFEPSYAVVDAACAEDADPKKVGVGTETPAICSFVFSVFFPSFDYAVYEYLSIAFFSIPSTVSFRTFGHARLAWKLDPCVMIMFSKVMTAVFLTSDLLFEPRL